MIDFEEIREHCLEKPGVTEGFPFGEDVLVFKVAEKMFLLTNLATQPPSFNAKCDPERALELREEYDNIQPGYHLNTRHWNTVTLDGSIPDDLARELIDHSYDLVMSKLPKKTRLALKGSE